MKIDTKTILFSLWIFVMFNYLYCDLLALMDPELLKGFLAGDVGGIKITQGFLLNAAILMEIPIAMILISRILQYRFNRWANIFAGVFMTLVQIGSLFFGTSPTMYYIFFSIVEISATAAIAILAWKWKE